MLKANSVMLKALKKDTTNKENIGLLNIFKVFKHILTLSTFLVVYMKIILLKSSKVILCDNRGK